MLAWIRALLTVWLFAFASGCATKRAFRVVPPGTESVDIRFHNAREAAAFVALPGDLLLMHLGDSATGRWAKQLGVYPAGLVDLLDFQDPFVKYLHAEVIHALPEGRQLGTYGFYPLIKSYHRNQFGQSFSVFTVTGADRARVLDRTASGDYAKTGYCGDFVSWCYENRIYSWWNRVPGLQRVIGFAYPFEAIQTADHIAQSPETIQVFEVFGGKPVYPDSIKTIEFLLRLETAGQSRSVKVVAHVAHVRNQLKRHGVLHPDGRIRAAAFNLTWPAPSGQ